MSEYYEVALGSRPQGRLSSYSGSYRESSQFNGYYYMGTHDPRRQEKNGNVLLQLRYLIESSIDLDFRDKSFCEDKNFLQRFVYAAKQDAARAFNLLKSYLRYRHTNRNLLHNLNIFDEKIQLAIKDGNPAVLEQRDRRGRKVLTFTASHWNVCKYSLQDIYRALLLTLDKLLEDVHNQMLGFVIVVDWTDCTLQQSWSLTPSVLKLMIDGLQDCIPVKFKGVHFIAQPYYVDMVLACIKPFIKDKMKERFHIHGTNMSSLHRSIAKDVLPPELGGEAANHNCLDWFNFLVYSSQMSETPNSYRLIKTNVYSTTTTTTTNTSPTECN